LTRERYTVQELNLTIGPYVHGHAADASGDGAHSGRLYIWR